MFMAMGGGILFKRNYIKRIIRNNPHTPRNTASTSTMARVSRWQ
jgi:hypothetical protein